MSMANVGGLAGGAAKGLQAGQQYDFNENYGPLQMRHLDLQNQKLQEDLSSGRGYRGFNDSLGSSGIDDVREFNRKYNYQGKIPLGQEDPNAGGQTLPPGAENLFPVNQMPQYGAGGPALQRPMNIPGVNFSPYDYMMGYNPDPTQSNSLFNFNSGVGNYWGIGG